jgi:hypothetical protein
MGHPKPGSRPLGVDATSLCQENAGQWKTGQMEMCCAECSCVVDRGEVTERCGNPECCCKDLPEKNMDEMAALVRRGTGGRGFDWLH